MPDLAEEIAGLVEVIVRPLIDNQDELVIESSLEADTVYVDIKVHPDEVGRIIGRQGRVIKAIRTVARAAAARDGRHVEVELLD